MQKKIIMLILVSTLIFSAAPDWVKPGTTIEYALNSGGSSQSSVVYKVTDINGNDIKLSLSVGGSPAGNPTDNASADSGSFWYDKTKTSTINIGGTIDDWLVVDKDVNVNAGGQDWSTIDLKKTLSGIPTEKWVDKKTGIIIKQQNSYQSILFKSVDPSFNPAPPANPPPSSPPPSPNPLPKANVLPNTSSPPPQNPVLVTSNTSGMASTTETNSSLPSAGDLKPPDASVPCCPLAFMLLTLGIVGYTARK